MIRVSDSLSFRELDEILREAFADVDFVGQLPIDRGGFESMCRIIKRDLIRSGKPDIKHLPAALFVTSMVFTARHSEINARNFWQPYAYLIWGLDEASQSFQSRCRRQFHLAVEELENKFEFSFPRRTQGDVVRPVYRHAIIPYYLQDDFANWLKDRWQDILEIPSERLVYQLKSESSVRYLAPTLKRFIQDEETSDAAAELITNMASAASLYAQGESADNISSLLASSPIEGALWSELQKVYEQEAETVARTKSKSMLRWIWSLDDYEMRIQLLNLTISHLSSRPERLVWVAEDEESLEASVMEYVSPWEVDPGGWLIDEVILAQVQPYGSVALLGEDGSILHTEPVPDLPSEPLTIFRSAQQNTYGIPVDLNAPSLSSGLWYISSAANVFIRDSEGAVINPRESLPVPSLLETHSRHTRAGLYQLEFPVTVWRGDFPWEKFERKGIRTGQPYIAGRNGNEVRDLSVRVPPVFTDLDVWLVVPDASERLVNRATLSLKSADKSDFVPLEAIRERGDLELGDSGELHVYLGNILSSEPATYTLQLRLGLQPVFASEIQFSVLPGIQIEPPELSQVYSPLDNPTCRIRGVDSSHVSTSRRGVVNEIAPNDLIITWQDLRESCLLHLEFGSRRIRLAWDTQRVFAWLEPHYPISQVSIDELEHATLHIIGPPKQLFEVRVGNARDYSREIAFDAQGRYTNVFRHDPLFDMVRTYPSTHAEVNVRVDDTDWCFLEVDKDLVIQGAHALYRDEDIEPSIVFRCELAQPWSGEFDFRLRCLHSGKTEILALVDRLSNEHVFPFAPEPGYYVLEVLRDGERLELPPSSMGFMVGSIYGEVNPLTDERLGNLLSDDRKYFVPLSSIDSYISFLVSQAPYRRQLAPNQLFRLATISTNRYRHIAQDMLGSIWAPLERFVQVHDFTQWERDYDLLPAWAVLDQPVFVDLVLNRRRITLKVFPEKAFLQGRKGVGYTHLAVGNDPNIYSQVYVRWHIGEGDTVEILLGLPDNRHPSSYAEIDELDVWRLQQCSHCGGLVGIRGSNLPPEIEEQHLHGQSAADFLWTEYDVQLYGHFSLSQQTEKQLKYRYKLPKEFVDRAQLLKYSKGVDIRSGLLDSGALTQQAYRYASYQWIERYRGDQDAKRNLNRLTQAPEWNASLDALETHLLDTNAAKTAPAYAAAGRFFAAFQSGANGQAPVGQIDKKMLLLALLLRALAHDRSAGMMVTERFNLDYSDLADMLFIADQYCPELLLWAFTWIELFFVHAAS